MGEVNLARFSFGPQHLWQGFEVLVDCPLVKQQEEGRRYCLAGGVAMSTSILDATWRTECVHRRAVCKDLRLPVFAPELRR